MRYLVTGFKASERRACRVLGVQRSIIRYRSRADAQIPLRMRLKDLAAARVRWGYRRLHVLLGREGWKVNHIRDATGVGARVPALQAGRAGIADETTAKEARRHTAGTLPAGDGSERALEHGFPGGPACRWPRLSGAYVGGQR